MQRRRFLFASLASFTAGGFLGRAALAAVGEELGIEDGGEGAWAGAPGVFGSREVASKSFQILPQWARVLGQMQFDRPHLARCGRDMAACDRPDGAAWHRLIGKARVLPADEQIVYVNSYFNRWPYKPDQDLYGVSEYWASPLEFLGRSGDCEDYSIAKFFALRQLGISNDRLRVVILLDAARGIGHAVLAFYRDDEIYILDSLSDEILPHWHYRHYLPQYSMNETTRWAHRPV